jgi:uncharacterized protein DUF6494
MNEDRFNMEVRKFLKQVGITSQREIEIAVRQSLADRKLRDNSTLNARMVLSIPELGLTHEIKGTIAIG